MEQTLCGLSVVPIIIDRQNNASALQLTSRQPSDLELCKDCEKAEEGEITISNKDTTPIDNKVEIA